LAPLAAAQDQTKWRRRMSLASTLGAIIDIGSRPTASVRVPIPGAEARRAARSNRAGSSRRLRHKTPPPTPFLAMTALLSVWKFWKSQHASELARGAFSRNALGMVAPAAKTNS
jgi:hypothetical protein